MTVNDMTHSETITIAAAPAEIYDTIRQLERMGEWSPENTGGEWLEGDGSSAGDQFEGTNRIGEREWSVVATVNQAEPGKRFGFYTGSADDPLVQWSYQLEASDGGTAVTEVWDVVKLPSTLAEASAERLAGRKAMVQEGMATTLANLKSTLEG